MSAYREGREAYYRGDWILDNPYLENDAQYDAWADGWYDAYSEEELEE